MEQLQYNHVYNSDIFTLCDKLADASVDMILTDLPYGMTNCRWDSIIPIDAMWEQFTRIIKDNGAIVLTAVQPFTSMLIASNYEMYRHNWIWDKNRAPNFMNAKREPLRQHEDIIVFSKKAVNYNPIMVASEPHVRGSNSKNNGTVYGKRKQAKKTIAHDKYPKTILKIPTTDNAQKFHPTQKPVKLFKYLIETYTDARAIVFDPCCGSGTTAIACQKSKRNYICGDISAEYVEIARNRTGEQLTFKHDEPAEGKQQLNLFATS
jgi:site-specific DNA-methyltransferase (adenine-specific)